MKKVVAPAAIVVSAILGGCASQPKEIPAQSVSTVQYQEYSCPQVSQEAERVSGRVNELYGSLKHKADGDAMQMGVGLLLFWPTLFLLEGGDGPEAQEYARLKGEHEALEKVSIGKDCGTIAKFKTPEEFEAEEKAKQAASEEG